MYPLTANQASFARYLSDYAVKGYMSQSFYLHSPQVI